MGPPEPTPLPKGILKNSSTVYDEVASYSTLPPDKVHQYWHVYTTTNKKLKDPTARRLENFWWHVWGSDRSKLSGRVLARIFQDISLGPTVVPLKGPPNRWEGPDASPLTIELIVAHLQKNSKPNGKSAVRSSSSALHSLQLPPILKKVGSSSTNIAKNNTRFVSPQESAEEVGVESGAASSGSTLANDFDGVGHAVVSNRANLQASDMFQRPQSPTDSHELASTSSAAREYPARNGESNLRVRQVRNRGQPEVYSRIKRTGTTTPCAGSLAQYDHKATSKLSTPSPHDHVYDHYNYTLVEFDHILASLAQLRHPRSIRHIASSITYMNIELSWQTEDSRKIQLRKIE
ncbi:hypothetical protein MY10362_005757 [Beauveria mimosiformis]